MSLVPTYPLINEKKVRRYAKRKVLSAEGKEGEVYWAYESGRMFIYSKEEKLIRMAKRCCYFILG
jgi:hypothetical protein